MIVPDVNLLIYATDRATTRHGAALGWWTETLNGPEPVGLTWSTVLAYVRLTTSLRIAQHPLSTDIAIATVESWLALPHVVVVEPTGRHLAILRGLLAESGAAGNLVTDAHLAALAIEHGATLCSADSDFARFAGLRLHNPLAG